MNLLQFSDHQTRPKGFLDVSEREWKSLIVLHRGDYIYILKTLTLMGWRPNGGAGPHTQRTHTI
jgi:hypothetical protein